jgi:ribosomal protein S18 acetylase RimI-like enzyme
MACIRHAVTQPPPAPVTALSMRLAEEGTMPATIAPVRLPPERLGEAAAVLGSAVVDDPLFVALLPGAQQRASGVPKVMAMFLRLGLAHGEVWVTPPPITGVACWLPPAHTAITEEDRNAAGWQEVGNALGREAVDRFQAFLCDRDDAVGSLAPQPHWHLTWLGVEPGHQGQGIGSTLVRQLTTRAGAEGVACWLYTFAPRNVPIYEHLGFQVTLDTLLPSSGLGLWVMARPPHVQ